MALPNLSTLSLVPGSRPRSLLGLAKVTETEVKRSRPADGVEGRAVDVPGTDREATDEAREAPPVRARGMRFCMLLHGRERATDEEGESGESLPTRSQLAANLPEFQERCSISEAGRETVKVVRSGMGTAGVVYDSLTFAVLAVATLQNVDLLAPYTWVERMLKTYRAMHQPAANKVLQEFARNLESGDVKQWLRLFNYLDSDKELTFYVDYVCSAASTARVPGRIGAGTRVVQGLSNWISNRFIKPAAMILSVEADDAHREAASGGDEAYEAADRYNLILGRIHALTWFHLQSLPQAEGFWGGQMYFVKYQNDPPMYFRWVKAYVQEPNGPRRLMPLPEILLPGVKPPYDVSMNMMAKSLAFLVRALYAMLKLWYPFLRPTKPSNSSKVNTVHQFLQWYDTYTKLEREFQTGSDGRLNITYVVRNGGEELTQLQRDFMHLLTTTLVNAPRPDGKTAKLFFGARGSLAHNNFHHFKHHLQLIAGKGGIANVHTLNKVPQQEWEALRSDPPSTYVGEFIRSVAELVGAAPDSMKVNVVSKAAAVYEDVDVQLLEHVKAVYAVFFLWYPQLRPRRMVKYEEEDILTLKAFVELYNRFVKTTPLSEELVEVRPKVSNGHGQGAISKVKQDVLTLAYTSLRNVRRIGASADALGATGTLDEAFLAYAKAKMREATLVNEGAAPKALNSVAESYWKELREAGLLQGAAQPAGPPSGSNEHFVRTALKRITNPWGISDGSLEEVLVEVHNIAQALHNLCYKLRPSSPFLLYMLSVSAGSLVDLPLDDFLRRIYTEIPTYIIPAPDNFELEDFRFSNHVRNAVINALAHISMRGEALAKMAGGSSRASEKAISFMLGHIAKLEMPDKALSNSELTVHTTEHWTQLYKSPPPGPVGAIFTAFRQAEHLEAYRNISVAKRSLERSREALETKTRELESYTKRGGAEALLARIRGEIATSQGDISTKAAALEDLETKREALPVEPIGHLNFQRYSNMLEELFP